MAAFFFVVAAALPAALLLPGKTDIEPTRRVDKSTPTHFRLLYFGLIILALLISFESVMELRESNGTSTTTVASAVGTQPTPTTILEAEQTVAAETVTNADVAGDVDGHPDYFVLCAVLLAWFGPILGMSCLPVASDHQIAPTDEEEAMICAEDNIGKDEEQTGKSGFARMVSNTNGEYDAVAADDEEEAGDNTTVTDQLLTESITTGQDIDDDPEDKEDGDDNDGADDEYDGVVGDVNDNGDETEIAGNVSDPTRNRNLAQMMGTSAAWLMLWTCIILVGGGTVMTNNMAQMVESLGFSPTVTSASMALFSVAQSGARVLTGAISEWALQTKVEWCGLRMEGIPRPAFLVVASAVGVCAHLLLAVATSQVPFIIGVAMSGAAFGMCWPLMVLIVGELFGSTNVGANYMFYDGATSALGPLILSKFVAQRVYDSHISGGPDSKTCIGLDCFSGTNYTVAALCTTCLLSSICMVFTPTARKVYG